MESDQSDRIKRDFFQAIAISELLLGCTIRNPRDVDGNVLDTSIILYLVSDLCSCET